MKISGSKESSRRILINHILLKQYWEEKSRFCWYVYVYVLCSGLAESVHRTRFLSMHPVQLYRISPSERTQACNLMLITHCFEIMTK